MRGGIAHLGHQPARELHREGLGLAPREVDQDVGDVVGLGREVEPRDRVGPVLAFGQPSGGGVRRRFRQGVDRGALRIAVAARQRIGMDRDEQPGLRASARWLTRSASGTKVSSVRVISTRYLPVFSIWSRSSSEKSSTIDFSSSPLAARVPLSMPPWPGSMTTSGRGSAFRFRTWPRRRRGCSRTPARGFRARWRA